MNDKDNKEQGLSRRGFITTAAIGSAATFYLSGAKLTAFASEQSSKQRNLNADPLPSNSKPTKWDDTTDVVVVGGGSSGLAAAVSAAETGAKVIVVEKNPFCGGDSQFASAFGTAGGPVASRFVRKQGVPCPPISEHVKAELTGPDATGGKSPALVRTIIEHQAETLDWLEDLGVRYASGPVFGLPPGVVHVPIDPEHPDGGWYRWHPHTARGFTQALEKRARSLAITFLTETPAIGLVTEGNQVIGITAQPVNAKPIHIKAASVVLTTGGFGANKDMLQKYLPPRRIAAYRYWGLPSATGDGIRMAEAIGAEITAMDEAEIWDGGALHDFGPHGAYTTPNQLVRQKSLTVNKLGQRFFDESLYAGLFYSYQAAQTIAQLDHTSFTLFDSNCISKEDIIKKFEPEICEYPCPWWDEQFQKYVEDGTIMKSDSIRGLARKMEVDPASLEETIVRYNACCDKGVDSEFFKEAKYLHAIKKPPFYAVKQFGGSLFETYGGLIVDNRFHVLNKKRQAIPGLYVAGQNAAFGTNLAFALPGGHLAGRFAAEDALGKGPRTA
jgi:fumarate reductase flavoprotein subunit